MDEKTEEDARDRFSDLPEFIMHQIMSSLTRKEAARTSVLSKRWKDIWDSFPIFYYDKSCYVKAQRNLIFYGYEKDEVKTEVDKFVNMVHHSLVKFQKHNLQMKKLKLHMHHFYSGVESLIDEWIGLALEKDVKELDLCVPPIQSDNFYSLPDEIFGADSMNSCELEKPFSGTRKFYFLESLSLNQVQLSEILILNLLQSCPSIVDLKLFSCWGFKKLQLSGLRKLKTVVVTRTHDLDKVDIDAPSLEYFSLGSYPYYDDSISFTFNLSTCKNLRVLHLGNSDMITDWVVSRVISAFPVLEILHLFDCDKLERIHISSNQLEKLRISSCEMVVEVRVNAPKLLSYAYYGIKVPSLRLLNVPSHLQIHFALNYKDSFDNILLLSLKEFFNLPYEGKDCDLFLNPHEVMLENIEELRQIMQSPICILDTLTLYAEDHQWPPFLGFMTLIDALLSICRPKTLLLHFDQTPDTDKFIGAIQEIMFYETYDCCIGRTCWRHYVRCWDMEYEEYEAEEPQSPLLCEPSNIPDTMIRFQLEWCFHFRFLAI